jgi:hypothetical protein
VIASTQEGERNVEICDSLGRIDRNKILRSIPKIAPCLATAINPGKQRNFPVSRRFHYPSEVSILESHRGRALRKDPYVNYPMVIAKHSDWNTIVNLAGKSYISIDRQHLSSSLHFTFHQSCWRRKSVGLIGLDSIALKTLIIAASYILRPKPYIHSLNRTKG